MDVAVKTYSSLYLEVRFILSKAVPATATGYSAVKYGRTVIPVCSKYHARLTWRVPPKLNLIRKAHSYA
eukprot:1901366-Pleurochrysis_carterae.AAC.1